MSLSTTEVEYIAVATCCSQVLCMKKTMKDIQVEILEPIPIQCDNSSPINISKNPVMHSRKKYVAIKYHFLREKVADKEVIVEYVPTVEQIADIFTKPLPLGPFEYFKQKMGVVPPSDST